MRILYLHPRSWTGEAPILRKLRQMGHEVCVLEERRKSDAGKSDMTPDFSEPGDGIPTLWYAPRRGLGKLLTWPVDRFFKRAFDGRNLAHRMRVIKNASHRFRPDIMVCTDGFTYAIPAAFLKRLGLLRIPLIASYIGGDILDCPDANVGKRRTPLVTWLIRTSLPGIDLMRPLCNSLARILVAEGAPPDRIHVVPIQLGVENEVLAAVAARRKAIGAELRERYGIPPEAPLIVTLSGNQKGKGLHLLARAWPAIAAAVPGCRWLLCGPEDPWLAEGVWPELRKAGLDQSVCFAGGLRGTAVFEHLAAGDLHVNPTLCEGLNMVTVEAAAVGTPTVGTDGAGISDWMLRYAAGAVVPAGQAAPLADAIIFALKDPARLAAWSAAGREMIAEFTLDRVAAQLVALFEHARGSRTEP